MSDVAPQTVQPSPVPTTYAIGEAQGGDGTVLVVVQVMTPTGTQVLFLEGQMAEWLGNQLINRGRMAKAGLIVPQNLRPLNGEGGEKPGG